VPYLSALEVCSRPPPLSDATAVHNTDCGILDSGMSCITNRRDAVRSVDDGRCSTRSSIDGPTARTGHRAPNPPSQAVANDHHTSVARYIRNCPHGMRTLCLAAAALPLPADLFRRPTPPLRAGRRLYKATTRQLHCDT